MEHRSEPLAINPLRARPPTPLKQQLRGLAALESSNRRNPNAQVRDRAPVSRPDVPAYRRRGQKPRVGLQEGHQRRYRLGHPGHGLR